MQYKNYKDTHNMKKKFFYNNLQFYIALY